MWKVDWTRYVTEQIRWAEALIARAEDLPVPEARALTAKSAQTLAEASRLLSESLGGGDAPYPR